MVSIAICDDMTDQLEQLAALTNEYIKERGLVADVRAFSHPDQLLDASAKTPFQLYILDIVMPMLSGVQLGVELRRGDREAQILFVTTEPGFALESFSANPVGYLVKPINKENFFEVLSLAISKTAAVEKATMAIKTKDGLRVVAANSILYCERVRNSVSIALVTMERLDAMTIRVPFTEYLSPLLETGKFVQPHASFVINMARVERMTNTEFVMQGGAVIPIAKGSQAAVKKTYLDYVFDRGTTV